MMRFAALALAALLALAPTANATKVGTVGASSARGYGFMVGGGPTMTFDLTVSGTNLSLNASKLTATKITANGATSPRTLPQLTTGKCYVEAVWNTGGTPADGGIGISRASWNPTGTLIGGSASSIGIRGNGFGNNDGAAWASGVADLTWTDGTWLFMAFDVPNSLVWFKKQGGTNWNNSGTANPATGVGGLLLSGSGNILVGGYIFNFSVPQTMTLNAGATAFVGTPPAGFGVCNH